MNHVFMHGFTALVFLITVSAVRADTVLSGTVDSISIDDNAVVPSNTTVVLNRTTIQGNLFVHQGAILYAKGATILGNIQADGAQIVDLDQWTFEDGRVESTSVDGDVQGVRTGSISIRNTLVRGNVQLEEGVASTLEDAALLVADTHVDGDVQAKLSEGSLEATGNQIGGNLQFTENFTGPYLISNNKIDEDLQFFENRGAGTITDNFVDGNLQSKENNPSPTISDNTVEGDLEIEDSTTDISDFLLY